MKLKLTNSQMLCLVWVVEAVCDTYDAWLAKNTLNIEHRLYKTVFDELSLKLREKTLLYKNNYSHTLKAHQAICFWLVFQNVQFSRDQYTENVVRQLCDKIHQTYLC